MRAYTGRTDPDERIRLEEALKDDELKALVATSALGMGFDKPNLGFVVHLGAPSSPVAYYQQVGRAGRATESADVLLMPGHEDTDIWHYFATASMPSPGKASAVLNALGDEPLSTPALEARVDIRRTPLELLLKVLDVDGSVRRVQGGWVATGQPWTYDEERYERIAESRRVEQQSMLAYERGEGCRMEHLQRELDDPTAAPCGRCDVCAGPWYPTDATPEAVATASGALDRVGVPIEPRAQWPTGAGRLGVEADGKPVSGKIAADDRPETGRVVARLTDLGWGGVAARAVRRGSARSAAERRAARRLRPRPARLGLGRAAGRCRRRGVRRRGRSWSGRSPRASPDSDDCRCSGSSSSPTALRPRPRAATAPIAWPGCGGGSTSGPTSPPR